MLKFGTSGLRGPAEDLIEKGATRYAHGFARYLLDTGYARVGDTVFLGRDRRDSSPQIARHCCLGISHAGLRPVDCGILPTPALALYAIGLNAPALMVTGSHIPAEQNGLKFYRPDGEISKSDEALIAAAAQCSFSYGSVAERPATFTDRAAIEYRTRYTTAFDGALQGLRVGIYTHASSGREIVCDVLKHLGVTTIELGRSDRFVAVDTEAVSSEISVRIGEWAGEHKLDAIVSTDGDADRPFIADELGTQVRGDVVGFLTSQILKADVIVTPVTSNSGIRDQNGLSVVRTAVGSPFVLEEILRLRSKEPKCCVVGFEANGGFILASPARMRGHYIEPLPTRDSLLPILCTLAAISMNKQPLSKIVKQLRFPFTASGLCRNVSANSASTFFRWLGESELNVASVVSEAGTPLKTITIDGLQIFLTDGSMMHFRQSGNAPEMRCYGEAATAARAQLIVDLGLRYFTDFMTKQRDAIG